MSADLILSPLAVGLLTRIGKKGALELRKLLEKSKHGKRVDQYLRLRVDQHSSIRSILDPRRKVSLKETFVPPAVTVRGTKLTNLDIRSLCQPGSATLISALGGSGKSTLLKYVLVREAMQGDTLPLFFELRHFPGDHDAALLDYFSAEISLDPKESPREYLRSLLRTGQCSILLDGFDEVAPARRAWVARQIEKLQEEYATTRIIVTSRPGSQLEHSDFHTHAVVSPLNFQQAVLLVERSKFDVEAKTSFLATLTEDYFRDHAEYLSNPLLLSIRLLVNSDYGDSPRTRRDFIYQAFDVLFRRHDASKSGYTRKLHSGLDFLQFQEAVSAFAAITRQEFWLHGTSYEDSCRASRESARLCKSDFEPELFLRDLTESTCLLVEEGDLLRFLHRDFHEYFTACFVASQRPEIQAKLITRLASPALLGTEEGLFDLLYEISPRAVEQHLLLPVLDELHARLQGHTDPLDQMLAYHNYLTPRFTLYSTPIHVVVDPEEGEVNELVGLSHTVGDRLLNVSLRIMRKQGLLPRVFSSTKEAESSKELLCEALELEFGEDPRVSPLGIRNSESVARAFAEDPYYGVTACEEMMLLRSKLMQKEQEHASGIVEIFNLD